MSPARIVLPSWDDSITEKTSHRGNRAWSIIDRLTKSKFSSHHKRNSSLTSPFWQDLVPVPEIPHSLPLDVTSLPRKLLLPHEIEITEIPPELLVASLGSGKLKCIDVTKAFLRRARVAQKMLNCINEPLPENALIRARDLDRHYAEYGKPIGPLHGLPVCVAEHVDIRGPPYSAGSVAWTGKLADDDAHVLRVLWKAGCVFYVRAAVIPAETQPDRSKNPASTTQEAPINPYNRQADAGGYTGGDGALLALRGGCLVVGSDVCGNIRSAAASNGLYAFKSTGFRIPKLWQSIPQDGHGHLWGTQAPLSTSLGGIKLFMKTALGAEPWREDPSLRSSRWHDEKSNIRRDRCKRLKVGVMWHDGIVLPQPPILRALREVVRKLKDIEEVEVFDWLPYKHDVAWDILEQLVFLEGDKQAWDLINSIGKPWKHMLKFIVKDDPEHAPDNLVEIKDLAERRDQYRQEYNKRWTATATTTNEEGPPPDRMDVILCPASAGMAPLGEGGHHLAYLSQWNLLDYPSLVFPVTKADPHVDVQDEWYVPINEHDRRNYDLYEDAEQYAGAPVALQLVGRRYEDEKVVEALEFIKERVELPFVPMI